MHIAPVYNAHSIVLSILYLSFYYLILFLVLQTTCLMYVRVCENVFGHLNLSFWSYSQILASSYNLHHRYWTKVSIIYIIVNCAIWPNKADRYCNAFQDHDISFFWFLFSV